MTPKTTTMLSKSRFLAGLQCPLHLWYQCYNSDMAAEISPSRQAIFDAGHEVGVLATRLYPRGIMIKEDHLHHEKAVQSTLAAMKDPNIKAIYEAGFLYDDVRIRVDVLERLDTGGWNLIEVKSSASVKDVYLYDVAVQYYVLLGTGLDINQAFLLHVNNQYVYDGQKIDLEKYFSYSDVTDDVLLLQEDIPVRLAQFKDMLKGPDPPVVQPSRHCNNPYECEFLEHCIRHMPEHWVMRLTGITQGRLNELAAMGVYDISEIPDDFPLTEVQERIKRCVIDNDEYLSQELFDLLKNVQYPAHFLDFETVGPVIPRYPNTRPYQTIPFQWSDHILYEGGDLVHREYLCDEDKDPREEFTRTVLDALGNQGTIFIYTAYEKRIIKDLAEFLPDFRDRLLALQDRFRDLQALIKKYYYTSAFRGSFSLKSVLPALIPDMNYGSLAIQEGSLASLEYLRMLDPSILTEEKNKIKEDLLTYCAYDTLAMVKIRDQLMKKFQEL